MENNIGEKNTKLSKELTNPDELSIKMKIFIFTFMSFAKKISICSSVVFF